ncbi:MAG: hypothetical protein ACFCBU_15590 [Cyanophyceae cyanobacterium]
MDVTEWRSLRVELPLADLYKTVEFEEESDTTEGNAAGLDAQ